MDPATHRSFRDAVKVDDVGTIGYLLQEYPDAIRAHMPAFDETWLGYAAGEGKLRCVKALVAAGADVNLASQRDSIAPICRAAGRGHRDVVGFLLSCDAVLNVSSSITNPLMWAVTHWEKAEETEIVKMLLRAGINSTVKYAFSGRTKTKMPLDAIGKSLLWGTPSKAGVVAAWNAKGNESECRKLLSAAMIAADSHVTRHKCGTKKLAEITLKREASLQKAIESAITASF
jgi:Ankyrin repeats (3 copies)